MIITFLVIMMLLFVIELIFIHSYSCKDLKSVQCLLTTILVLSGFLSLSCVALLFNLNLLFLLLLFSFLMFCFEGSELLLFLYNIYVSPFLILFCLFLYFLFNFFIGTNLYYLYNLNAKSLIFFMFLFIIFIYYF